MAPSAMLSALLQNVILATLYQLVKHHFDDDGTFYGLWENEGVKNYTQVFNSTMNDAVGKSLAMKNMTRPALNSTTTTAHSEPTAPKASPVLHIFIITLAFPLLYYWHIWLERTFPARPRGIAAPQSKEEKVKVNDDHDDELREEAVVKKWIARGKVRRSSLSVWNTLIKWLFHLTAGRLWYDAVWQVLWMVITKKSLSGITRVMQPIPVIFRLFSTWFSMAPLWYLLAFVVVPAPRRAVFVMAVSLVWLTFTCSFLSVFVPWAVSTSFVQDVLRNITETVRATEENPRRLLDEL